MTKHIKQWEILGETDPYWAVLTVPDKKGGKWDKRDFFATGEIEINNVFDVLKKEKINIRFVTALDFGCGVGRLSRALAARFEKVVGVDISHTMLSEAVRVNFDIPNLTFNLVNGENLENIPDNSVDFIYSNIALQHSPAKVQENAINDFFRVLVPGGIAVFQTPSHEAPNFMGLAHKLINNKILNVLRKFKYGKNSIMEIHTLHKGRVARVISSNGGSLLHQERFDSTGQAFVGMRYIVKKLV